jgi:hypothetical protein
MWKLTLGYGIWSQYCQTNLFCRFFEFRVLFLHMIFILFLILFPILFLLCSSIISYIYIPRGAFHYLFSPIPLFLPTYLSLIYPNAWPNVPYVLLQLVPSFELSIIVKLACHAQKSKRMNFNRSYIQLNKPVKWDNLDEVSIFKSNCVKLSLEFVNFAPTLQKRSIKKYEFKLIDFS